MKILNRQETEELVRDLYYNQKKTYREIRKIVRKSPRDIKAIIDKANPDKPSSLSASSQAYRMFKEGSHPTDVAIMLNLRQKEVSELSKEYWDLNGLYILNQLYEEIKDVDAIWSISELYKQMKSAGMNPEHVMAIPVRQLLRFAVASIFESGRKHPGKFHAMYYHMSTAEIQSMLRTSIGRNDHNSSQDGNNQDTPEKILLDEAEQVFNKLIDNITGKCIDEITTDTNPISQMEQVSGFQYDTSQDEGYQRP